MSTSQRSIRTLVSQFVEPLANYNAGLSLEELKRRYNVSKIAKLASNENPFGTSEAVKQILAQPDNLAYYPDPNCTDVRALLAEKLTIDADKLVFGNGSEDLLNILCHIFLEPGEQVLTVVPSFGLHILYPQSCGAEMLIAPMTADLQFDLAKITELLAHKPKLFFIASPSNPVGCSLNADEIQQILEAQSEQTLFVFDEAYYEYAQTDSAYPDALALLAASGKPYILLRTLSKAYSLAGLRMGYGICCSKELASYIDKLRTPFNVNRLAQRAAIAALTDEQHLRETLAWNDRARAQMSAKLRALGLNPAPSHGNFLFVATPLKATDLAQRLLEYGVIIKPWMEAGYEHYIRVSIGSASENEHFIETLTEILQR